MPRPLLRELASTLLTGTSKGKVKWNATAVANAFRVAVASKTIQLKKEAEYNERSGDPEDYYEFEVLSEQDDIIDSIKTFSGDDYVLLEALYDEARASALNIDSELGNLLKELKRGT